MISVCKNFPQGGLVNHACHSRQMKRNFAFLQQLKSPHSDKMEEEN